MKKDSFSSSLPTPRKGSSKRSNYFGQSYYEEQYKELKKTLKSTNSKFTSEEPITQAFLVLMHLKAPSTLAKIFKRKSSTVSLYNVFDLFLKIFEKTDSKSIMNFILNLNQEIGLLLSLCMEPNVKNRAVVQFGSTLALKILMEASYWLESNHRKFKNENKDFTLKRREIVFKYPRNKIGNKSSKSLKALFIKYLILSLIQSKISEEFQKVNSRPAHSTFSLKFDKHKYSKKKGNQDPDFKLVFKESEHIFMFLLSIRTESSPEQVKFKPFVFILDQEILDCIKNIKRDLIDDNSNLDIEEGSPAELENKKYKPLSKNKSTYLPLHVQKCQKLCLILIGLFELEGIKTCRIKSLFVSLRSQKEISIILVILDFFEKFEVEAISVPILKPYWTSISDSFLSELILQICKHRHLVSTVLEYDILSKLLEMLKNTIRAHHYMDISLIPTRNRIDSLQLRLTSNILSENSMIADIAAMTQIQLDNSFDSFQEKFASFYILLLEQAGFQTWKYSLNDVEKVYSLFLTNDSYHSIIYIMDRNIVSKLFNKVMDILFCQVSYAFGEGGDIIDIVVDIFRSFGCTETNCNCFIGKSIKLLFKLSLKLEATILKKLFHNFSDFILLLIENSRIKKQVFCCFLRPFIKYFESTLKQNNMTIYSLHVKFKGQQSEEFNIEAKKTKGFDFEDVCINNFDTEKNLNVDHEEGRSGIESSLNYSETLKSYQGEDSISDNKREIIADLKATPQLNKTSKDAAAGNSFLEFPTIRELFLSEEKNSTIIDKDEYQRLPEIMEDSPESYKMITKNPEIDTINLDIPRISIHKSFKISNSQISKHLNSPSLLKVNS